MPTMKITERGLTPKEVAARLMKRLFLEGVYAPPKEMFESTADCLLTEKQYAKVATQYDKLCARFLKVVDGIMLGEDEQELAKEAEAAKNARPMIENDTDNRTAWGLCNQLHR
jgi:hypothetical protein